jgi:hypothetical protein
MLPALSEFSSMEHTDRMNFRTTHMETGPLRGSLYFDNNLFIRTLIWVIKNALESEEQSL